jgi:plasmid stabilization system protein ParE
VDYRIFFTQKALTDLAALIGHIAEDDAEAASRFGKALLDHVDLLSRFPRMGNIIGRRACVRKLVHSPIVVYDQLQEDRRLVEILQFRHGSRKTPAANERE